MKTTHSDCLRTWILAGFVAGSASFFAGCSPKAAVARNDPAVPGPPALPPAAAAAVVSEPCKPRSSWALKLNGRVTWDDNVTTRLFSPFAGRVARILVETGQVVHRGDALALIDSPDYGLAQAERARAASDHALAEKNLQRVQELYENGAAPAKDLSAAEADFARTESELRRTSSRLAMYGDTNDTIDLHYTLRSPIDGVVVEKNLNPGQEVRPDQMLAGTAPLASPLFVVTDPTQLWVQVDAGERDLPHLKKAGELVVRASVYPERHFAGRIEHIADAVDPSSRTIRVRGSVANADRLLKGEMLVEVEMAVQAAGLVDVPSRAVFLQRDRHHVIVETGPGKYENREVRLGPEAEGRTLVLEGLKSGDRVVCEGALLVAQEIEDARQG